MFSQSTDVIVLHNARKATFEALQAIYIDKICCFDNSIELYTYVVLLEQTTVNTRTLRGEKAPAAGKSIQWNHLTEAVYHERRIIS